MPEKFTESQVSFAGSPTLAEFHHNIGVPLGALAAAVAYLVFAWLRLRAMVRTFDQQTRQKI
jgi:hypothetical protein